MDYTGREESPRCLRVGCGVGRGPAVMEPIKNDNKSDMEDEEGVIAPENGRIGVSSIEMRTHQG